MASLDPVAIDAAAARIAWLNPNKIKYFQVAEKEGIGKRTFVPKGMSLDYFRALYPKRTFKMKMKARAYKLVVRAGLGKRLGLRINERVVKMKNVKLGIIGLGYIGQLHLRHSLKLPNAEVVAVADTSSKALDKAKTLGVKKTFTDYADLLKDPQVDAVLISLPTHLHLKCTQQAAEAKKDIFLEKPIAVTVDQAKEVISVAQRNSVKLMLGYPLRFNKNFIKAKEDLENGLIGDVENAHATYISSGPFFHRAEEHSPVPVPDWWFNTELYRRRCPCGFGRVT